MYHGIFVSPFYKSNIFGVIVFVNFTLRPNKSSEATFSKKDMGSLYQRASHHSFFWPILSMYYGIFFVWHFILIFFSTPLFFKFLMRFFFLPPLFFSPHFFFNFFEFYLHHFFLPHFIWPPFFQLFRLFFYPHLFFQLFCFFLPQFFILIAQLFLILNEKI